MCPGEASECEAHMPQGRIDDGLVGDIVVEVVSIDVVNGFVASQLDCGFSLFSLQLDLVGVDALHGLRDDRVLDGHVYLQRNMRCTLSISLYVLAARSSMPLFRDSIDGIYREEKAVNQENLRIGHVYQRQDGSRFIVTGLVPGYDHIGYVQDISGMNQGTRSTEDSHTFRDRGIVFDASSNMSHGIISMFN